MKDVEIIFDGGDTTKLNLTGKVERKRLYMQKASVNIVTEAGSDALYPSRGTDLLKKAISGKLLDALASTHAGNFAALDTLNFINWQEYKAVQQSGDLIKDINIDINSFSLESGICTFTCYFLFADHTSTASSESVTYI